MTNFKKEAIILCNHFLIISQNVEGKYFTLYNYLKFDNLCWRDTND